jgi:hypothetical protein
MRGYSYRVTWSAEDNEYVATVAEFPSLSWLVDTPLEALKGITDLVNGPSAEVAIKSTQHCTSEECEYTLSHTASWCRYDQPRRCGCPYCYPKGER